MIYGSVCSGIEAATAAWHGLGWKPAFFSEIEAFPRAVLAHHYPDVPLHGDFTTIQKGQYAAIDLLVGGTPCQSFSVAGLRAGLDDPRGNLMLEFGALARRLGPTWLVWENVPGVLSSNKGRDFGTFLGMLGELGYGFAYRVLDAQYFGVAQRRRRVFVVGYLGDWRPAAAVLFERHSLQGNPAPSRQAGKDVAPTIRAGAANGGKGHGARSGDSKDELIVPVNTLCVATGQAGAEIGADMAPTLNCNHEAPYIAHTIHTNVGRSDRGDGNDNLLVEPFTLAIRGRKDGHHLEYRQDGTANALLTPNGGRGGIGVGAVAVRTANTSANGDGLSDEVAHTLDQAQGQAIAYRTAGDGAVYEEGDATAPLTTGTDPSSNIVGFAQNQRDEVRTMDVAGALAAEPGAKQQTYAQIGMQVRRLTPRECERLQGFKDDYTLIQFRNKPAADGPRYKALGNSMAVPCMHWIGSRIQAVLELMELEAAA